MGCFALIPLVMDVSLLSTDSLQFLAQVSAEKLWPRVQLQFI